MIRKQTIQADYHVFVNTRAEPSAVKDAKDAAQSIPKKGSLGHEYPHKKCLFSADKLTNNCSIGIDSAGTFYTFSALTIPINPHVEAQGLHYSFN